MQSEDEIYKKLHREIDERMPIGFPAHESGLELEILKLLFTPEEAEIAIHLSALPEPLDKIYKRVKKHGISISKEKLEDLLNNLSDKGAIQGGGSVFDKKHNRRRYRLAQWAIGIFEYQLGKITKEFAELAKNYSLDVFYEEFHKKNTISQMRTIPVEKSLSLDYNVSTYENIQDIIMNKVDRIAILNCVCREERDVLEEPCKLSSMRRCCVMFNDAAERRINDGLGVEVSKEEIFDILKKYQKEGFVLQPENTQNPSFMCVCCGCCCGVLTMAKQFPKPSEYYSSNFYAQSNPELCNGCEVCVKRCQMEAVKIENNHAVVNLDRCIGCGNCVPTCGMKAMTLHKKRKSFVPPKSHGKMYVKIMMKKRGFLGTLKMVGKIITGRKV
ncbi:MAG: 4Fe-4S binding protein [Promethearchaeota archaeon]|nr:MAG: 4Fe-4S binding protein [Candidatus Lokiarchaeota archaeon]